VNSPPVPRLGAKVWLSLFVLALAARLAVVAWSGFSTYAFGDARAYLYAARTLAKTGHYPRSTEPFYFRAPGYPVFLAAVTLGHPERIAVAKSANAVAASLAVPLLASLSARIFRRRDLAIATGLLAAIHPGLLSLSLDIESEPLFLLLLVGAGFLLLAAVDRPSSNLALLSGVLAAGAALTRPSGLLLAPFLAAPLFDRRYPPRARAHLAASALLGFGLALAPWTLRNLRVFHELLPVNDAAGSAFYQGNSDWTVRFYRLRSRDEYREWTRAMFSDLARQTAELERRGITSPAGRSRFFIRKAVGERSADPVGWARLLALKAWDFVRPYPNPMFWPRPVVVAVGAFGAALMLLAGLGLSAAGRRGVRVFALLFLAATLAAHVMLLVVWRYRIPYWDPVLLLYAPAGAPLLSSGRRQRS
jgi:hypothetical protein